MGRGETVTKELELTPAPAKRNRDEAIALKHLCDRRDTVEARQAKDEKILAKLDAAILALE